MGLGFFIAKALLEGTGAQVSFENRRWGENSTENGAVVKAHWPLNVLSVASTA